MGWAFLPPIQRQLAEPIQALSRGFAPGAWDSPMFTGEMTHAVSGAAPRGLIDGDGGGLGTPLQRVTQGPELTLLPPPRPRAARTGPPTADGVGDDRQPMVLADPDDRAPAGPVRSLTSAAPAGLPILQRAAVVTPTAPTAPTGSAEPALVSDPVEVPEAADAAAVSSQAEPDQAVGLLGGRPPDLPADAAPPGSPVVAADGIQARPLTGPSPTVQRSAVPPPGRVTGERPRLGLGPPLPHVPPSAVGSPPADPGAPIGPLPGVGADGYTEVALPSVPQQPAAPLPLQRAAGAEGGAPASASASANHPSAGIPDPSPDVGGAAGSAAHVDPVLAPHGGHTDAVLPTDDVVPAPTAVSLAPLVLADTPPLHGAGLSTSIQRSTALPGPGLPMPALSVRPAGAPASPDGRVVRLQRMSPPGPPPAAPPAPRAWASASSAAVATRTPASTSASPPGAARVPVVQRSTTTPIGLPHSAGHAALASVRAPGSSPTSTRATTGPPVLPAALSAADALGDPVPLEAPDHDHGAGHGTGRVAGHAADPAAAIAGPGPAVPAAPPAAVPAGVLQRSAAPHVAVAPDAATGHHRSHQPAPMTLPAPSAGPGPTPPALALAQRAAVADAAQEPSAVVQREEAAAPDVGVETAPAPPQPAGAHGAPATAAAAPAAAAPAPAAPQTPEQAETLARQLFPPMLRMIRSELVVDRERRGIRTDRW